jgi:hypothetical protein
MLEAVLPSVSSAGKAGKLAQGLTGNFGVELMITYE